MGFRTTADNPVYMVYFIHLSFRWSKTLDLLEMLLSKMLMCLTMSVVITFLDPPQGISSVYFISNIKNPVN